MGYMGMGGYQNANGFSANGMNAVGGMNIFGNRSKPAPVQNIAKQYEVTRTPEEALQEYLRVQPGMTLEQLKAQIEQKRQAMANMPTMAPQSVGKPMTLEELNARYVAPPTRGFAEGGLADQVPKDDANKAAWDSRANAGVRKDTAYRPDVPVTYKDGKFVQAWPGYEISYAEDPREYVWDKFGNKTGRLPSTFGGVSNSFGLQNPFNVDAIGTGKALKYAKGGLFSLDAIKDAVGTGEAVPHKNRSLEDLTAELKMIQNVPNNAALAVEGGDVSAYIKKIKDAIDARHAEANQAHYINSTQAIMQPTTSVPTVSPTSIEELNAKYYQGGNPYGKPFGQGYAEGGEVKGYARGTENGAFEEESAPTITPYQMPEAPIAQAIPQPNYAPITSGQIEPSGGGAMPQAPQLAPAMTMANPELNALIQQYNPSADYGPELRQARADRKASEAAFNSSLDKLMSATDEGPSKAEMYWKLASAFGTPTKTGAFGEGLAQAGAAMADTKKEERVARLSKRKLGAEIAMKKQEMALEGAKDTEKTLLGLQSESNKDKREFIKAQVKEYIDSGKPQSNAGKIAKDKGFKPGTEEYQAEVDKQVNLEIEKQLGVINAQLQSGKVALANLGIAQEKSAREAIKLEPDERKAIRDDEDAMFAAKSTIKNLDSAIGFVDQAFTNTAADQAAYKKLKQTSPTDPRVKATEELENLIGQNVVGSLKTTFGGNPTEGERRALQELGGLGSANKEVRKAIMARAKKALEEAADYRSARITKIETGGYRKKTEPEGKK
jgi:hypothetical protein